MTVKIQIVHEQFDTQLHMNKNESNQKLIETTTCKTVAIF